MTLDDPQAARPPRIARLFLVAAVALSVGSAGLAFHLVRSTTAERVRVEIARTARLVGGSGFPLHDDALRRVSGLVGADVVAVGADGRVVASSLPPPGRAGFEAALARGALPSPGRGAARGLAAGAPGGGAAVADATVGGARFTVGVAPAPGRAGAPLGAVYFLYPEDLLAAEARRAWLPVTAVAALGTLAAALLGLLSERSVRRARVAALLRLLAAVAHEVRNPLGSIRALAGFLSRSGQGDPRPLELIAAEAERLSLLVDGLRSVGRPVATVRRRGAPDASVAGVLALVRPQLAHRRVELAADLQAGGARADFDPTQVQQVALNLIENAADAQPTGGRVAVRTRALPPAPDAAGGDGAGTWQLVVEDDGPGVSPAARRRLFEPFFTTKAKGLGVGLYLSRRLAEAQGGALELAPAGAQAGGLAGARFVLTLPVAASAAPGDAAPGDAAPAATAGAHVGAGPREVDADGPRAGLAAAPGAPAVAVEAAAGGAAP